MTGVLLVPLIVITAAVVWYADVRLFHPWRTCPSCGGAKRHRGMVPRTHGDCRRCGSTGRIRRLGAGRER